MNRFISLDAELDVLAGRAGLPAQQARPAVVVDLRGRRAANTPTRLIQPPRLVEIDTSGEAVTMRSAESPAAGERRRARRRTPPAMLVARCGSDSSVRVGAAVAARTARAACPRAAAGQARAPRRSRARPRRESGSKRRPRRRRVGTERLGAARRSARRSSSAEWFSGWPANGRPPALHRVREDHRGRAGRRRRRRARSSSDRDVVAAEVAEQAGSVLVGVSRARARGRRGRRAARRRAALAAPRRRAGGPASWYSSLGMSSMRRRSAAPPGALECGLQAAARTWPRGRASRAARNVASNCRTRTPG